MPCEWRLFLYSHKTALAAGCLQRRFRLLLVHITVSQTNVMDWYTSIPLKAIGSFGSYVSEVLLTTMTNKSPSFIFRWSVAMLPHVAVSIPTDGGQWPCNCAYNTAFLLIISCNHWPPHVGVVSSTCSSSLELIPLHAI